MGVRSATSPHTGPARVLVTLVVALILSGSAVWAPAPAAAAGVTETEMRVTSGSGADAVELDTTLFIPDGAESEPAPAIIVAHGFGGGKNSVQGVASKLAENGYVALTYTARGFGESTGEISIDAPDYEIADARTMIDLLAERPEVLQDSEGDPRVGMYGRSYGGALALLTAGYDERVDVISPGSTWNSLVSSIFPNDAGAPPALTPAADPPPSEDGVFKRSWAEIFVEAGGGVLPAPGEPASSMQCGNFRPELCSALGESAADGELTPELQQLMEASSPASVLDRITAPTLFVQGEGDTLFPLSEADANARGIAANGTPVKMIWYSGGHGGQTTKGDTRLQLNELSAWFDYYLRGEGDQPDTTFTYSLFQGDGTSRTGTPPVLESVDAYPGLGSGGGGVARTDIALTGDPQEVLSPAGGTPAALSALPPGLELDEENPRTDENPIDIPGQFAVFESAAFESDMQVLGAPVIDVQIASSTGDAVIFGKVYDVDPDGTATLLRGLVAPIRLGGLAESLDSAEPVTLTLPAIAHVFPAGHQMQVALASTDQVYELPSDERTYQVMLSSGTVGVPQGDGVVVAASSGKGAPPVRLFVIIGVAVLVVIAIGAGIVTLRRKRRRTPSWS